MDSSKKISPSAILALKEALIYIYWKKDDLKLFIRQTIAHKAIVETIDWSQYKRAIVESIISRMSNRPDIYQDDILSLILAVSDMNDFEHLRDWQDGEMKIKKAKECVESLRNHSLGFIEQQKEKDEARKNKDRYQSIIKSNQKMFNALAALKSTFFSISSIDNNQERGYKFESFLNQLFLLYDLDPKCSYKTNGEQIDGAFTHNNQDYLIEAKWVANRISPSTLYSFEGKINTKLKTTLGLFIAINGFSDECSSINRTSSLLLMDYVDILCVLENRIELPDLIYRKKQHASQTGEILFHPVCFNG